MISLTQIGEAKPSSVTISLFPFNKPLFVALEWRLSIKTTLTFFLFPLTVSSAIADDGTYRGKLDASGSCFRNMTYADFEAKVEGAKVSGNWNNPALAAPAQFTGDANLAGFQATRDSSGGRTYVIGKQIGPTTIDVTLQGGSCKISSRAKKVD